MNDSSQEHTERPATSTPEERAPSPTPPPEVHREREIIISNGGERRSGPGTAIMVVFAFVALVVIAVLAFTFIQRDGGDIIPDELDINIEMPGVTDGS
jgi:hypothetical protein